MRNLYDIAIIGAGPAGLSAAYKIVNTNPSVKLLLIEKSTGREKSIPCAEGVGRRGFHEVMKARPEWIRSVVKTAAFHSPNETVIRFTDDNDQGKGYIIDRARWQQDIIDYCVEKGAHGLFETSVTEISETSEQNTRKITLSNGETREAKVVIDCSGPLSTIGKKDNIYRKPLDLEPAYFAHVNGVKTEMDTVHLYVGDKIAPGGYAWSFPRDEQSVNVGLVLGSHIDKKGINISDLLDNFIKAKFPGAEIVTKKAGPIPCHSTRGVYAVKGLLRAGDAISTVNPISRAGITEAMKSGTMAAEYAILMLNETNDGKIRKICRRYERAWLKKLGKTHEKLATVKRFLLKVSDDSYNKGAEKLSLIPKEKLTMAKIFKACLGSFPQLVFALRKLM